ncbi:hypothetical protein EVAR_96108_1 [Eumeta japonica]|uniref:Uncharacterized protein n=1 Tax=Eumeta variegata TaxID=151549 RepID=A0A4C1VDD4_EUMVA|nr:hypothetical protein EVAR_96108_1 [Eumeta japonica]
MYTVVNSTIEPSEKGVAHSLAHDNASPHCTHYYLWTVYIYSIAWYKTGSSVFSPALLRKQIKSIVKRLNSRDDTEEEKRSGSQTGVELRPETSEPQLTLKEGLQLKIDKSMKSRDPEVQLQNE